MKTMLSKYREVISFLLICTLRYAFFHKIRFDNNDKFETNNRLITDIIGAKPLQKLVLITDHRGIPENLLYTLFQQCSVYITSPRTNIKMIQTERFMLINEENLYVTFLEDAEDWHEKMTGVVSMKFWRPRNRMLFLSRNPSDRMIIELGNWARDEFLAPNLAFLHLDSDTIIRYNSFSRRLIRTRDARVVFEDISKDLHGYQLRITMFNFYLSLWDGKKYIGRDRLVADAVVKHLNASVKYVLLTKNNTRCPIARDMIGIPHREQNCQLLDGSAHLTFNTRFLIYYFKHYVSFIILYKLYYNRLSILRFPK